MFKTIQTFWAKIPKKEGGFLRKTLKSKLSVTGSGYNNLFTARTLFFYNFAPLNLAGSTCDFQQINLT